MKKKSLAIFLAAISVAHVAHGSEYGTIKLQDPRTSASVDLSASELSNPETMRNFLVLAEGAEVLFDTYLRHGYRPMDAMMFANWDVSEGLRKATPGIPENIALKSKVSEMLGTYKPISGNNQ